MEDLPKGTFRLEGHIDVPTERYDVVSEALKTHIDLTRDEEGCIFFNVDACTNIKGRFLVSEAFVDEAAFQFHQERAGNSPWAEITVGILRHFEKWVVM